MTRDPRDVSFSVFTTDGWIDGVITDHVGRALEAGYVVHVAASGRTYIAPEAGGTAVPVLCGEIVAVPTEDGWVDGRCASPVMNDDVACPGHAAQINAWRDERQWDEPDDAPGLWIDGMGALHEGI